MVFNNPYFTAENKLDLLARWLIVHSILYYVLDSSIVSDFRWTENAFQFVALAEREEAAFKRSRYFKAMQGFDGSTGFQLMKQLSKEERTRLEGEATWLLRMNNGQWKGKLK